MLIKVYITFRQGLECWLKYNLKVTSNQYIYIYVYFLYMYVNIYK
jgi:hypothetical protein